MTPREMDDHLSALFRGAPNNSVRIIASAMRVMLMTGCAEDMLGLGMLALWARDLANPAFGRLKAQLVLTGEVAPMEDRFSPSVE